MSAANSTLHPWPNLSPLFVPPVMPFAPPQPPSPPPTSSGFREATALPFTSKDNVVQAPQPKLVSIPTSASYVRKPPTLPIPAPPSPSPSGNPSPPPTKPCSNHLSLPQAQISSSASHHTVRSSHSNQSSKFQPPPLTSHPGDNMPACPVSPSRFDSLLDGFPRREYVVHGFSHGFQSHFQGPDTGLQSRNSHAALANPDAVDTKLGAELTSRRVAGPFDQPPFDNFKCSPLSIREKSTPGQYRLLHNLSYPYDERSVNHNIPSHHTTVQYSRIQDAIAIVQDLGPGCYMAKSDIQHAFRIVPLHPSQYHLMGFKWRESYYYDKFLAMGLAESCRIFETISDALLHILKHRFHIHNVVKILDDFLFLERTQEECSRSLQTFLDLASYIGIPISKEKTTKVPDTSVVFLGITLDSKTMTARLPPDKLGNYSEAIRELLAHKSIKVRDLQSVIGRLQFATSVVTVGKPFLRRLIDQLSHTDKPYWHLKLHQGAREDLSMWLTFLDSYNGVSIIRQRPITPSTSVKLFSDASKLGFGATYGSDWVQGEWSQACKSLNIAVLELYPILHIVQLFGHKLASSSVLFYCDNQAIVQVINKQTSKDKHIMKLLRPLVLLLLQHDIRFKATYIPTHDNILADAISRFQETPHFLQCYGMKPSPYPVPASLRLDTFMA